MAQQIQVGTRVRQASGGTGVVKAIDSISGRIAIRWDSSGNTFTYASADVAARFSIVQPVANIKFTVYGVELTKAAYENLDEAGMLDGVDMARDIEHLKSGYVAPCQLLECCLDGAESDRVEGWRDYVAACCREAGVESPR